MACCGGWHPLGRVTGPDRQSLHDIWSGRAAEALRSAVSDHDYTLGCWECGHAAVAGRRDTSLAVEFDRWSTPTMAPYPSVMDFALSNRCNLECVMCNGGLSSTIRARRERRPPLPQAYDDRFFEGLWEFLPHVRRALFKGGEPFLSPEHRRIWDRLLETGDRPEISITTNGSIWNESVERYLRDLRMEVIISVDAIDPALLSRIRVGLDPHRFWRNVDRIQAVTTNTGQPLTLSFCLMAHNWRELGSFLAETDRRGVAADVIWVDGPDRFNLLTSPPTELAATLQDLEADAARREGLSAPARRLWDDTLARLRAAVAASSPGVVRVAAPTGSRYPQLDAYRSELRGSSPAGLLELEYRDAVIRAVKIPEWAVPLEPQEWIGIGLDETMTVLATRGPGVMRSSIETLAGGVHRAQLVFEGHASPFRLVALYIPQTDDLSTSHMLLSLVDAA